VTALWWVEGDVAAMLGGFVTEMVMRRTREWYHQRYQEGPDLKGVEPHALEHGSWFVHLDVEDDMPVRHALVRMRGMSVEGLEIVQADHVICPSCRARAGQ
jgi:hypothetical protein